MVRVHPIADVLRRAAEGDYPAVDGLWERVDPWRPGVEGVIAFTGHAYLAVGPDITDTGLDALGANGFGGATNPRLVAGLAATGWIDSLDIVLVARGTGCARGGEPALVPRTDLRNHPRAELATSLRSEVKTFGYAAHDDHTVVTLATGLGGLPEIGVETDPRHQRGASDEPAQPAQRHTGSDALRDALTLVPLGEVVVAACAPGNARALRAFLAAGFDPVAASQLWRPARPAGE